MSESRPVIEAKALTKVYKLYENPKQKFRDMLGMLRNVSALPEHRALDGIDLVIRPGERVGIIGRNGAGKSTLLKLISGVIEPTSGSLEVDGSARALLEIGTGFHPDFTGTENVRAYLAQIGITGTRALELLDEIVDFAELEEYIGQPLKTYSTGMAVRLMFATSTAVAPELLILDEVLGVGDAYFTRKSFDRIEDMCRRDGATLLLVSHDIYSSARLCERMIWLERGRIVFDGEPKEAIKAYEESIREQEEQRLRQKAVLALHTQGNAAITRDDGAGSLFVEIAARDRRPQRVAVQFHRLALLDGDDVVLEFPLTSSVDDDTQLVSEGTCWGDIGEWCGLPSREMRNFGSPFHKVAVVGHHPDVAEVVARSTARLSITYGADEPFDLIVRGFLAGREILAQPLPTSVGRWTTAELAVAREDAAISAIGERTGRFGTGSIEVTGVRLLDADGGETFSFTHGRPFRIELDYVVHDPDFPGPCDVNIGIQRGGVETSCRIFSGDLVLGRPSGRITMTLERLGLGAGEYSLNVMIAKSGYFDAAGRQFFSINPDVFASVHGLVDFTVRAEGVVPNGTAWVAAGDWSTL